MSKIVQTEDLSNTLFSERFGEHYHSIHGAENESMHIFINAGLRQTKKKEISIFEMGLGTGLNAFLTLKEAQKNNLIIDYTAIEMYPIKEEVYQNLNYAESELKRYYLLMHKSNWGISTEISSHFFLTKIKDSIVNFRHSKKYDLIYYDAFSPDTQPELWTKEIFESLFKSMNEGGIFMTYTVKGIVKRALKSVGFKVEKLPGPVGKREILKATKVTKKNS